MDIKEFISKIPKAELHLHIEGTLEPELFFELAKRNGISIPYTTVNELRSAYQFDCLQDFLDIYYKGTQVLIHEQDFFNLTWAYLTKCKEQNVVHTEIMFDPQSHTDRGVAFETVINGISKACQKAKQECGISSFLIMSYLRHLSEESAFEILEMSKPFKHLIKAVGLDSSELGHPPSKFQRVFDASVKEGYIPLAHAGEEGPTEYIWEAIDILKIHRIDHGNRCLEDEKLIQEIMKRDLALKICPLSNKALQVVKDFKNHPLKKMLDLGLKVTVNSDDPAYFGGQLIANFEAITEELNLSKDEIVQLVRNSFQYALLSEDVKKIRLEELDKFLAI
ncbi:MAG: adenosine deaminase [Chitinophagales bacterium]|jgi:adenosine deaminase|nr:adenosine deaminase [Sphingobacteriales bacterium]